MIRRTTARSITRATILPSLMLATVTAGCGPTGRAPTAPASGVLQADGRPLGSVNVTFTPTSGRSASATTDESGSFTLSTFTSGDGAVPGTHRVTLSLSTVDIPMPGTPEAATYVPPKAPFASTYLGLGTTDLTVDLPASGNRAIVLDVAGADVPSGG
jgi:hypothetical protein